jgi:hypothetical protein
MAPGTGQRSLHTEQNDVSAIQYRPWMMAVSGAASAAPDGSGGRGKATDFALKGRAKAAKNPRLETAALMDWKRVGTQLKEALSVERGRAAEARRGAVHR